ncbi:conjugal transfer protein TraG N-terminal domain-containing protein [Sphingomonas sp. HH69]
MVEVFTIGGGEYIVNTFNAVAAWTGGGGYKSLIKVVLVIGLIYALLSVAFTMNFRAWMNWFLGSTLIYTCLMVPTVDVKVTDRVNPSLAPATVANVPLGLGVIASFTSQVGDWLTRTAETVFVMPSQLNYSTNGMIYGARLFDQTRNFQIRDAEFATNLQAHFKQCVFGDILLYRKSLTVLAQSKDLWTDIGPGSEARAQPWLDRSGGTVTSSIITCRNAYNALSGQWASMIDAATPFWAKETYPKLSTAQAAAKLRQDVPIANTAFTTATSDYTGTMRQTTAINAFMQARDGMAGSTASASIDTFATTRADIQARNTYNSIAQQAMSWVPILNIVLTVVFYAMFPVIFPLFLMPQTGVSALKGYLTGFFYLAAWGPLYVILHMICMTRATTAATGVAEGGMSLGTYAGIGAVNAETATIAGFMLMSVPFIAGGLAKGAMGISGQATSMLAPAQNAAEAAAVEQTTGNYSYGNTSFANSTSNMRQTSQWSDAPTYSTGVSGFTNRFDGGATESRYGGGGAVIDTSGAMSKLSFTPTMNSGFVGETRQQASMLTRAAETLENSAASIRSATHTDRSSRGRSNEFTSGSESSSGSQHGTNLESFDRKSESDYNGTENRSGTNQSYKVTDGTHRAAEEVHTVNGSLSAGGGGGGGGGKKGASGRSNVVGGSIAANASISQTDRLNHNTDRSRTRDDGSSATDGARSEHANGDSASKSDGTYSRGGVFSRGSSTSSSSVSQEDALSVANSFEQRARQMREKAQQLSNDASYAETHNLQMSENLSQELAEWYRQEASRMPPGLAPSLRDVSLDGAQRQVRDGMVARFMEERRQSVYDEVAPYLKEPELAADLVAPAVSSAADVNASYHPQGLGSVPKVGSAADGSAAEARIEAGKADIAGKAEARRYMRGSSVIAGSEVQSEVDRELDKGFFNDPKLRR